MDSRVRVERSEHDGFLSWWTDPKFRGQGLATAAVAAFLADSGRVEEWALIRPWNPASIAVAEKCGFTLVEGDDENLTYRWRRDRIT